MHKRVLLAGIFHETNTFLTGSTSPDEFAVRRGEELLEAAGDASPLAGTLEVARARHWEVLPVLDLRAMPGPTAADEVIRLFWDALREALLREAARLDGLYLVLHGAMVSESFPDAEGELLKRVRAVPGCSDLPLCGVVDLHANFTEDMARCTSGLIAYRENPHTDAKQAAVNAALLLDRLMETGERPVTVWRHPPLVWPPTGTGTASDPMKSLESRAREIEATHPEILAVNVFGGFAFADIPDAGVSLTAVTLGDPIEAGEKLRSLSDLALLRKEQGNPALISLEEAIGRIQKHRNGTALLVEPADNIGAGAPGDITFILKSLAEHGVSNAGVILNDPESVALLKGKPLKTGQLLSLGGKSGAVGAEPLPLEVELISKSDGKFTLEDPQSHLASMYGLHIDMGPCAVVRYRGIVILLTTRKTPPFDLGQWRSQGIAPESLSVIAVKAAVAHRRAYDPITGVSFTVDTPGPCAENLLRLPYRRIRRPIYPLDDERSS